MTIDTNIIIAYFGGDERVVATLSAWRERGMTLFLPTIVEAEILSFSRWSLKERSDVEEFLEKNFVSIPFDRPLARITADIRKKTKIKTPDAVIAATAIATQTALVTRDNKDSRNIGGFEIVQI